MLDAIETLDHDTFPNCLHWAYLYAPVDIIALLRNADSHLFCIIMDVSLDT